MNVSSINHSNVQNLRSLNNNKATKPQIAFKGEEAEEAAPKKSKSGSKKAFFVMLLMVVSSIISGVAGHNAGKKEATDIATEIFKQANENGYSGMVLKDKNDDGAPEMSFTNKDGDTVTFDIKNNKETLEQNGREYERKIVEDAGFNPGSLIKIEKTETDKAE